MQHSPFGLTQHKVPQPGDPVLPPRSSTHTELESESQMYSLLSLPSQPLSQNCKKPAMTWPPTGQSKDSRSCHYVLCSGVGILLLQ